MTGRSSWYPVLWLGILLGCGGKPPAAPPPPAVTVAVVPEREVTEWDEFTGRMEAVDAVEIRPRVSGYIKKVDFAEGKEVRKGEVLSEINPRPYEADLARAQAQLEQARTEAALAGKEVVRAQRYNAYPAADINGAPAPGVSTGQANAIMERLAKETLPNGIGWEWTELTYQQILAGNTAVFSGMLGVTFFGLVLTPVFYVTIQSVVDRRRRATESRTEPALEGATHA